MAKKHSDDLFDVLRGRGLRKRVARTIAELDGSSRKVGTRGEKLARRAAEDLTHAAEDIRKRLLGEGSRTAAARKAAATRKRNAAKRSAAAKKGARTRAKAKH
jgi:hypothetical protein